MLKEYLEESISRITSLEEFIKNLNILNRIPSSIKNEAFLFRGIGNSSWSMIPGLYRGIIGEYRHLIRIMSLISTQVISI